MSIKNKKCTTCKYEPSWFMYDMGFCKFDVNLLKVPPGTKIITPHVKKGLITNCPTWEYKSK